MMFTKYEQFGDYHWREFENEVSYRQHALFIKKWVKEKDVFDIGCGDGLLTSLIGATGIDTEVEGIRLAHSHGVNASVGNVYNLKDIRNYEAVTLLDTLEHLEFPDLAINEIGKITNILYISVPLSTGKIEEFGYTQWTQKSLNDFMSSHGWKNVFSEISKQVGEKKIYAKYEK